VELHRLVGRLALRPASSGFGKRALRRSRQRAPAKRSAGGGILAAGFRSFVIGRHIQSLGAVCRLPQAFRFDLSLAARDPCEEALK
jgi:hypothetical protein